MDIVPEITRQSITNLVKNDKREDGRELIEYRDITIETNVISKAEGSARVTLGGTQVIVGIKPQLGSPFPDTPDLGVLMTNCEMLPMADPTFEPGPPSDDSIELARVVDRGIRESELVELSKISRRTPCPSLPITTAMAEISALRISSALSESAVTAMGIPFSRQAVFATCQVVCTTGVRNAAPMLARTTLWL